MSAQKYSVNQHLIETLLSWVKSGEIAIPEIQRPFVWDASKVRDLMDSLYQSFPVGYIIAWRNPTVKLKDGSLPVRFDFGEVMAMAVRGGLSVLPVRIHALKSPSLHRSLDRPGTGSSPGNLR
ncbi:DUF262 domain-containing protein [Pseudomonas syringae]|uniref:DUF262 domain-containing protein n=1 Tax=Pseudomonas syringae TaxID=317 RepID=UPI003F87DE8B